MLKVSKLLIAGISSILYHSTNIYKLQEILKDNKIHMSSTLGSEADKIYAQKKFRPYFFSLSRVKFGGYAGSLGEDGIATLVFDGSKLSENYYGQPVDYWGQDFRKIDPIRSNENEDRVYSDKPFIGPLSKYVTAIHVNLAKVYAKHIQEPDTELSDSEWDEYFKLNRVYATIINYAAALNIQVYFYADFGAFKTQSTGKAVTLGQGTVKRSHAYALNELFSVSDASSLSSEGKKALDAVLYSHDFKRALETDIHNSRNGNKEEKIVVDTLIANMRKNKLSDLQSVLDYLKDKFSGAKMLKVSALLTAKKKVTYEDESKQINERKKTPEGLKAHKFQAAEWTYPNGHPRCKICGDEESMDGKCPARKTADTIKDGIYSMTLDDAIKEHTKLVGILKKDDPKGLAAEIKDQGGELKEMVDAKKAE